MSKVLFEWGRILYLKLTIGSTSYSQSSLPHCFLLPCLPTTPHRWTSLTTQLLFRPNACLLCFSQPPAHGSLDLLFICLLSLTISFNSQSESDVTAIRIKQISSPIPRQPSLGNQRLHAVFVQRSGPSPHAASEGALAPLGHQGEDNSKTCCPRFLLHAVPTQLALVSSLSRWLDSTCLCIIFFGACLPWNARTWVWNQNNCSATAPPTHHWHFHGPLTTCYNKHWPSKTKVHLESQCRVSNVL